MKKQKKYTIIGLAVAASTPVWVIFTQNVLIQAICTGQPFCSAFIYWQSTMVSLFMPLLIGAAFIIFAVTKK